MEQTPPLPLFPPLRQSPLSGNTRVGAQAPPFPTPHSPCFLKDDLFKYSLILYLGFPFLVEFMQPVCNTLLGLNAIEISCLNFSCVLRYIVKENVPT